MKTVGIIQPGRLGDLIICLPITKYYHSKGYKVVWPVFKNYIDMFKEAVDYVKFEPTTDNVWECVPEAYRILKKYDIDITLDIAATFPGSYCTGKNQG